MIAPNNSIPVTTYVQKNRRYPFLRFNLYNIKSFTYIHYKILYVGNHCLKRLNDMDGYGLVVMGAFVLILSVIILIVYAGQEQKYKKAMGFPLLSFVADRNSYNLSADKTASEIKGMNFIALIRGC